MQNVNRSYYFYHFIILIEDCEVSPLLCFPTRTDHLRTSYDTEEKERDVIKSHKIQPRLRNPGELKRPHRIRLLEGLPMCRQRNPLCFDPFPMMRWERELRLVVGGCGQQPDKSLRLNLSATPHRGWN
ncbi:hypothetical protein AVEN_40833-1 [Araneus ventricosus]|uniref:Uncharacterized protein n=1 Tax=Araneus ventricosus TaxID=182803 RepID=A0A4Y2CG94_ARAVE|nr:hypothetical protein AVEN_40833-1 [Araneus ventricosus]